VTATAADCAVEAFFVEPYVDGVIESAIIDAIDDAEEYIYAALYSFTDDELGAALLRAHYRGVDVQVLLDRDETGGEACPLYEAGLTVLIEDSSYLFHHKFVVIDSELVITGSYNWSNSADRDNFENVVFIRCPDIALDYWLGFLHLSRDYFFVPPDDCNGNGDRCAGYPYAASKNSDVFHLTSCHYVANISSANLICFATREDAIASGRRPCKTCKP